MAAIGCIAAVPQRFFKNHYLNVCFSRKRSFKFNEKHQFGRPLTAISGHSSDKENPAQTEVIDQRDDAQGRAAVWALEPIDFVDFLNQPRTVRTVGVVAVVANGIFVLVGDVVHEELLPLQCRHVLTRERSLLGDMNSAVFGVTEPSAGVRTVAQAMSGTGW